MGDFKISASTNDYSQRLPTEILYKIIQKSIQPFTVRYTLSSRIQGIQTVPERWIPVLPDVQNLKAVSKAFRRETDRLLKQQFDGNFTLELCFRSRLPFEWINGSWRSYWQMRWLVENVRKLLLTYDLGSYHPPSVVKLLFDVLRWLRPSKVNIAFWRYLMLSQEQIPSVAMYTHKQQICLQNSELCYATVDAWKAILKRLLPQEAARTGGVRTPTEIEMTCKTDLTDGIAFSDFDLLSMLPAKLDEKIRVEYNVK